MINSKTEGRGLRFQGVSSLKGKYLQHAKVGCCSLDVGPADGFGEAVQREALQLQENSQPYPSVSPSKLLNLVMDQREQA